MPTYQYACTNPDGKHEFELVQSFSDAPASECPVCNSPVRKVYGSVGVVFKGSGFYRTDSRAGSSKTEAKTDAKTDAKTEAATSGSASGNGSAASQAKEGAGSSSGGAKASSSGGAKGAG